jgi:RNA polymerase sigma-70 factor (ECF subfamily)
MANAPDERLVRRAQQGNKAAFAELFTAYEGRIFGYVYRMVGDRAWAEDITQEAFIQAHQHLGKLGPPYDFKSWVYRIAGNLALDGLRRYKHEMPLPDWDGGEASAPEPADQRREGAPEDQAHLSEVRAAVWRAIHQLPDSHRQVLTLREIDGLSYNEIATVLGITLDNVRVTLHRARQQFRDLYGIQVMVEEGRTACQGLDTLLSAYMDEELDRPSRKRVKDHIKSCPVCQKKQRELLAVSGLLAAIAPVFPPLTLRQRFLSRLQNLPDPQPPSTDGGQPPPTGGGGEPTGYGGGSGGGNTPWFLVSLGGGIVILTILLALIGGLLIAPKMLVGPRPTTTPVATSVAPPPPPPAPTVQPRDTATPVPTIPTQTPPPSQPTSTPRPTSTSTPTPTTLPTHTSTPIPPTATSPPTPVAQIEFSVDANTVPAGTCTTIRWQTAHVQAVHLDQEGVAGSGSRQTCPCYGETHTLDVLLLNGSHDIRQIAIGVTGSCVTPTADTQGPPAPSGMSPSDDTVLSCRRKATVSWNATKDPSGVAGYYVRLERRVGTTAWEPVGQWGLLNGTETDVPVSCGLGYRWSVRARDGAGNLGPWSSWATFGIGID